MRIGVNWGSLDQELLTRLMDENATSRPAQGRRARSCTRPSCNPRCCRPPAPRSSAWAPDNIIISAKVSAVQDLVAVYTLLAGRCRYALHLGLTEAGMGSKGIVASTAAMGILLQQGIGDTIRVSLTPEPSGDRTLEVKVAQEILQTMGLRAFVPVVAACPGCGRTTSTVFQELARDVETMIRERMPEWKSRYPGVETLNLRGHGLHRQRPGREQARRHRHLAARHRRKPGRSRLHRRQEGHDLARPQHRR